MKILIATIDYPPIEGGIGTLCLETARALHELGHDVTVVAPWFPEMDEFDSDEPYTVHRFKGYHSGPLRLIPLWLAVSPRLRDADMLIAANVAYGGTIGRISSVPYTVFAYGYEFLKYTHRPFIASFIRASYARADHILAISEFTASALVDFGVNLEGIDVCLPGTSQPRAIDAATITKVRKRYVLEDHRVILSVGRMIPRKNQVALVHAMPKIVEAVPDAVLVIAGRGPEVHTISRAAVDLGAREYVLLPGRVSDDDLDALYEICDVFALANKETHGGSIEGFGLVFTEASARGKPVVGGRSGGAVEAIVDGETGLLVDPDDVDAIADAIIALLTDPDRAESMGEAGRLRVSQNLSWQAFARKAVGDVV